jgi:hypothetical protein
MIPLNSSSNRLQNEHKLEGEVFQLFVCQSMQGASIKVSIKSAAAQARQQEADHTGSGTSADIEQHKNRWQFQQRAPQIHS